ncbi:hypothetical protein ACIF9R_06565 [Streptomyces sp. NPDC086080]|uniref:hypothetical protein n=1 Tax=Streptomyces sp. NPDC086080 TaxID=3365748 RepID=UPI0037D93881
MRVFHSPAAQFAAFDDLDRVAHAGLVPTMRLAERCGLPRLAAEQVKLTGARNGAGTAADAKALSIVGDMIAGADSIDDLDVLRPGGLPRSKRARRAVASPATTRPSPPAPRP